PQIPFDRSARKVYLGYILGPINYEKTWFYPN
ncbi:unnamed protein product, partial [marine sediment metagenome]